MRTMLALAFGCLVWSWGAAAADKAEGEAIAYRVLPMTDFAAFVKNWNGGDDLPFCAVVRSPADWDAVFGPAVTMGNTKPTALDAAFYDKEQLLVVARVVPASETGESPLSVVSFVKTPKNQIFTYRFDPPEKAAGYSVKSVLLVAVSKEYTEPFYFLELREVMTIQ